MDSEELISRYKLLPLWGRLVFGAFLGIIPAYYTYLDDGALLEEQLVQMEDQLGAVQRKFDREKKKRDKLPELEAKLAFTEQQLTESSKRLPDDFMMDDVLQESASIARDVGIDLQVFDPGNPIDGSGAFKYKEMPIKLELTGSFQQIAGFFDRIVNMEKMVHVRDIKLKLMPDSKKEQDKIETENMTDSQKQRLARNNVRLEAEGTMVIYRAMTADEETLFTEPEKGKGKKNAKGNGVTFEENSDSLKASTIAKKITRKKNKG